MKFRQFGSVARIAAPSVRTVLTRIGDEWQNSRGIVLQMGKVARWGWFVIADIASHNLFGEPRKMSDEFVPDVQGTLQ